MRPSAVVSTTTFAKFLNTGKHDPQFVPHFAPGVLVGPHGEATAAQVFAAKQLVPLEAVLAVVA